MNNGNNDTSKNKNNKSIKTKSKHLMIGTAIFMVAVLAVSGSNMKAFADLLKDDVDSTYGGTTVSVQSGSSAVTIGPVQYWIQSVPAGNCDASDGSPAQVTISPQSPITAGPTILGFGICDTLKQPVTFTVPANTPAGTYTISASVADSSGSYNSAPATFFIKVTTPTTPPSTAPVIDPSSIPSNQVAEATSSSGATVSFSTPTATGSPTPTVSCSPASGSQFPLGATPVTCTATNSAGSASASFSVIVVDTTAPTLNLPSNPQTAEATGPTGAAVDFSATASDIVDGARPVTCSPPSGATFPLGTTTVNCEASDTSGHTAKGSFTVIVQDKTPPTLNLPSNPQTAEATGPTGAAVGFSATASDIVDTSVDVVCNPASGATFPLGTTTVTCTATDDFGNAASGSFDVIVQDKTPPTLSVPLSVPPVEATGPTGAAVGFSATASDIVDTSVDVVCNPASGATFPLGTTTVTCTATDDFGNAASGSFDVKVVDTTPPVIAAHADVSVGASSASGATVTYTNPIATDLPLSSPVDTSVDVVCKLASGSTFPIGITTVKCDATDDSGNKAIQTSFNVIVNIPSVQFPLPPVNPDGTSVFKGGSTVPFKLAAQYSTGAQAKDLVINLVIVKVSADAPSTPVNEAVSTSAATSGTLFRWDDTSQQHIFNLSTKGLDQTAKYNAYATVNGFSIVKQVAFGLK